MARTRWSLPSSRSHTSNGPSCSIRSAATRVRRTTSIGSLLGTIVVVKASRSPGSAATGTGSLARQADQHRVNELTRRMPSITTTPTIIR